MANNGFDTAHLPERRGSRSVKWDTMATKYGREDLIPLLLGSTRAPKQAARPGQSAGRRPAPAEKARQTGRTGPKPTARGAKAGPGRVTLTPWKGSKNGKKTEKKR